MCIRDSLTIAAKQYRVVVDNVADTARKIHESMCSQIKVPQPFLGKAPLHCRVPRRTGTSGPSLLLCAMVEIALCTMLCVRSIFHVVVSSVSCLLVKGMTGQQNDCEDPMVNHHLGSEKGRGQCSP